MRLPGTSVTVMSEEQGPVPSRSASKPLGVHKDVC